MYQPQNGPSVTRTTGSNLINFGITARRTDDTDSSSYSIPEIHSRAARPYKLAERKHIEPGNENARGARISALPPESLDEIDESVSRRVFRIEPKRIMQGEQRFTRS